MCPRYTSAILILALIVFVCCRNAHAGRPLVIDDAAPLSLHQVELELGVYGKRLVSDEREYVLPGIGLAYGVWPRVEIGLTLQRLEREESSADGFEDLHLTTKYGMFDETPRFPALALELAIKLPTANSRKGLSTGKSDQSFRISATKNFDSIAAHLNLGYLLVRSPPRDKLKNRIFGGVATEWLLGTGWAFVAEVFGVSREARAATNEVEFHTGLKYALSERLILDTAIGRSLLDTGTAVQGTVGLTWTVDVTTLLRR